MPRSRIRLEIRGIMAAVAVAALILCVYRVDVAPSVTVALILGSISVLARKVYSDLLAQSANEKQVATRAQRTILWLVAVFVAVTIIGLSDAAFLVGYYAFGEVLIPRSFGHQTTNIHAPDVEDLLMGAFCGLLMALVVAYSLRRTIWPIVNKPLPPATSPLEE